MIMRRYSLLLIVLIIIVCNGLMHRAAEASPLLDYNLWQIRHSLPTGLATAALFLAAIGMGAQFWQGALPIFGVQHSPTSAWVRMSASGLWCGWIPLLCATPFLPSMPGTPSLWLIGCFFALIMCRMLSIIVQRRAIGIITGALSLAAAVICSEILWPQAVLPLFLLGLVCSLALLLSARHEPPVWAALLMSGALILCALDSAMEQFTLPATEAGSSQANLPAQCVGYMMAIPALLMMTIRRLRHTLWGRRGMSIASLLLSVIWLWLHMSAPLSRGDMLSCAGFAALGLIFFGLPAGMMFSKTLHTKSPRS